MRLSNAVQGLLAAVYGGLSVKPAASIVAPGSEVAWDECCDGQLWIRVSGQEPALSSRAGAADPNCRLLGWYVTLGVGIIRCVASLDSRGSPPTPTAITEDGLTSIRDSVEIRTALVCADTSLRLTVLQWSPLGPAGGCAGGEWLVSIYLPAAD